MPTIKINGTTPGQLLDYTFEDTSGSNLGRARVQMVDTSTNRSFSPGDDVRISFGSVDWTGEVTGQPSQSNGTLSYTALGGALPLKHERAYRVFYEADRGDMVAALASERTKQLPETAVHTGDTPADWESVAPVAEPYAGTRASLYSYGTDLLFLGARPGHADELRTTYTNVSADAIADGFFQLRTRLLLVDFAGDFNLVVELRTPSGTSYRWQPDIVNGPHLYELAAEDAEPTDSGLSNGDLRYRLIPTGALGTEAGMFIDGAQTIPFRTEPRPNSPGTGNVASSGQTVTRRADGSVGELIDEAATADNATFYVRNNELYYLPGGAGDTTDTNLSISAGTTPVVSVDTTRDFESVRNEVLVNGDGGVEAIERNQTSIDFYGDPPRTRAISDPSIKTDETATERATGFLEGAAFDDADVTFSIADTDYGQLAAGERLPVTWPPENLDGVFEIERVNAQSDGIVDVTIAASTAQ